jgi:glycerophosphoryl diester phosphodiesterase
LLGVNISHPKDYIDTFKLEALHVDKDIVLKYPKHYASIASKVRVYTANDEEEVQKLKEMGIEAVMTDFPSRFL